MSSALEVTDATFDKEVAKAATPVLVDFFATWCAPCKAIAPILDEISRDLAGKLKVVKVDIDAAEELAQSFAISAVPTLVVMKGGKEVARLAPARSKLDLVAQIQPHL
jgi:thioredoxin 1